MNEYPGLEFAPQSPRSQISLSMPPLVLFIISMRIATKNKHKYACFWQLVATAVPWHRTGAGSIPAEGPIWWILFRFRF